MLLAVLGIFENCTEIMLVSLNYATYHQNYATWFVELNQQLTKDLEICSSWKSKKPDYTGSAYSKTDLHQ